MFWFSRRKRDLQAKSKQTDAILLEIKRKSLIAAKEREEVNRLIENNPGGIAELLVYATGNNRGRNSK